jgi:hypothetical protein
MNLGIERLGQGERIAAGSALALFACMFLSWFNFSYTASNAWESLHYISPILAISIMATLGIALAKVREFDIGEIPGGLVVFVLGCLSALLILFRLIDPVSTPGIEGGSTSGSIEAGAFLSFFAALGIAAGGYITTDGKAVDRLKALLPNSPGAPDNFPASPPPAPTPAQPQAAAPQASTPAPTASPPPAASGSTTPPIATETPERDGGGSEQPVGRGVSSGPGPELSAGPAGSMEAAPPAAPSQAEPPAEADPPAAAEEEPRSVFCEGCGGSLRPRDRFCRKCGHQQVQVGGAES